MFSLPANLQFFNRRINIYIIFLLLTEAVDTPSHRLIVRLDFISNFCVVVWKLCVLTELKRPFIG